MYAKWKKTFHYRGRPFTLFKRQDSRDAPYYIRFEKFKEQHLKQLESSDWKVAMANAKTFIDAVYARDWQKRETLLQRHRTATLEDVLRLYREVHGIKGRTARNNELAILQIFRRVHQKENATTITLDLLDRSLPVQYQDLIAKDYVATVSAKDEGAVREARDRAYRTSRSTLCQARSIFSRRAENDLVQRYIDAGLRLPESLKDFMTVKLRGASPKKEYNPPADAVIDRTFTRMDELCDTDRNVYFGFWLSTGAALRRSEIQRLEWNHFVEKDGMWWIDGGIGKDGRRVVVPIQSKAWERLSQFRLDHNGKPKTGRVIEGETGQEWAKRLNTHLRGLGWTTEKKMHELRAYIGSLIYQKSPLAAMHFLRHKSIAVTERYYVRYGTIRPVDVLP